ncbi:hypothetical protein NP233_g7221 [Leucocoprinus birnbaumii]|uniref:Transmembrane protein n=1 Tax=Leucocoprinus birnbaumii TaxID=56174 RepID=A0AAD5YUY6_9AGAR|nr:hypothetical protein NP233_g7221 [Leucocoprinus birnbaumii]
MTSSPDNNKQRGSPTSFKQTEYQSTSGLILRYVVFLIMEAMFTALAWYCYSRPLLLPLYINIQLDTVKSGFIAIFTVWHTIAIACAWFICAESFSMEWAARPGLKPTDKVSTVTSGILDHILYSFTSRSTKTFRAAVCAFLGLMILRATGSSAITATDGVKTREALPIGRIATSSITPDFINPSNSTFTSRLAQTYMVVRLEQLLGDPWGYVPQPNWLIPLPAEKLNMTSRLEYETDLVKFQYSCQWQAPMFSTFLKNTVMVDNEPWAGNFLVNGSSLVEQARHGPSIIPLRPLGSSSVGNFILLLLGGNVSIPLNSSNLDIAWLDLSGKPTTYSPEMFASSLPSSPINVLAPLATMLVCDPNLQFTSGKVLLDVKTNFTMPDITVQSTNLSTSPGNIEQLAARTLFTYALFYSFAGTDPGFVSVLATFDEQPTDYINFNSVAGKMLLQFPPPPRDFSRIGALPPMDLCTINNRMDSYMLSALKVFTSGFAGDQDIHQDGSVYTTVVDAQYTLVRLALVTTIRFAILHAALFGTLAFLLAELAYLNRTQGRIPFDLAHIAPEKYRERRGA